MPTLPVFRKHAEAMFQRSNPGSVVMRWVYGPRRVRYPTGLRGLFGRFEVSDGERIGLMVAEYDDVTGWAVTASCRPTRIVAA